MSYRIFGAEVSPYSIKVRSYFRYKQIPHEWVKRDSTNVEEFRKHARLPLIPLVIQPDGSAIQDSTPIIEKLEGERPEPPLQPENPALAFLSALLEEYGDEWGNKWMFHYRWTYEADQKATALRIARENAVGQSESAISALAEGIRARMLPRLSFVGSNETTRPIIEASFERVLRLLEPHLQARPYLFGGRPAFADFGLFPQIYQAWTDPTPKRMIEERAPRVMEWALRMLEPKAEGAFESWDRLGSTLEPLLEEDVGRRFLPWSAANAIALGAGEKKLSVELAGEPFVQDVQKYHAKSLGVLRERFAAVAGDAELRRILERVGCLRWLE